MYVCMYLLTCEQHQNTSDAQLDKSLQLLEMTRKSISEPVQFDQVEYGWLQEIHGDVKLEQE